MNTNLKLSIAYSKALYFLGLKNKKRRKKLRISRLIKPYKKIDENIYTIRQELFFFKAVFSSSKILLSFLLNPSIKNSIKEKIIQDLFPGTSSLINGFIKLLIKNNNFSLLPQIIDEFEKFFKKSQKYYKIIITLSSPIEKSSLTKLVKILKKITLVKHFLFSFNYNPGLLGGILISCDLFVSDLSIKKRFKNIIF
jgi:ATP synthase F1 delta subunit